MKQKNGKEMVRMENVVKRFGTFTALNEVSISIMEGEVVVIIGPSGIWEIDASAHHQPAGASRRGPHRG